MKAGYVLPTDANERPTFSITADQQVDGVTVPLRKGARSPAASSTATASR